MVQARVELEMALRAEGGFFRQILDSLTVQVLVIDEEYDIRFANKAFTKNMGTSLEDMVGRPCFEISHRAGEPCQSPLHACPLRGALARRRPIRTSHVHYDSRGKVSVVEITAAPLRGRKNGLRQVVEVIRDQTEQHQRDEAIVAVAQQIAAQDYLFRNRLADYRQLQEAYEPLARAIARLLAVVSGSSQIS